MPEQPNAAPRPSGRNLEPVIHYDEPARKRPPLTEVGLLGWLRQNLFGSMTDTVLTIISAVIIVYALTSFVTWSVVDADWGVVTRNLRLFMNGRYPLEEIFRTSIIVLLVVFMSGFSWRIMGRAPRWVGIGGVALLVILYVTPALTNALPFPPAYQLLNATSTESAFSGIYFIEGGQSLEISLFPADPRAGIPTGFSEVTSATEAGQAQIDAKIYDDLLAKANAGEAVELTEPPPDPQLDVVVQVLQGDTLEPLATLEADADDPQETHSTQVLIPTTGWYVIQPEYSGEAGAYWLKLDGIVVVPSSEVSKQALIDQYGPLPEMPDVNLKIVDTEFTKFRGERTLAQFLRLHVGSFFEAVREMVLALTVTLALGYAVATLLKGYDWARRLLSYLWALSFFLVVILLRGFYVDDNYSEVVGFGLLLLSLAILLPALSGVLSTHIVTLSERTQFGLIGTSVVVVTTLLTFSGGWNWQFALLAVMGMACIYYALDEPSRKVYVRLSVIGLLGVGAYFLVMQVLFGPQINAYLAGDGASRWALVFVPTERWGGLILTLALAIVSIVASFPVGVLLALGRRSNLPVIRWFCISAIEFVRGVPLITILFMASIMVPLLSPSFANIDSVIRSMVGLTFFSGAYVAEIVRGGLQAVPQGQAEAAKAVGLSGWQTTLYIVLPQALRAVIPALVGQFISLFKDTSLVFIIGLIELLGVARTVINQAEFIGTQNEALVFIGVIYFVGSYAMSSASRRIEATGVGAVRRL